jgi:hypothetical protein
MMHEYLRGEGSLAKRLNEVDLSVSWIIEAGGEFYGVFGVIDS